MGRNDIIWIPTAFTVIIVCNGTFAPNLSAGLHLNNKISRIESAVNEIHQCRFFYNAQYDYPKSKYLSSTFNCSHPAKQPYPLDLTADGYLQIWDHKNSAKAYYPPTQFCESSTKHTAQLCPSHDSPIVWRKCCPEHQMLSITTPRTCINSSLRFRPTSQSNPYPFTVKDTVSSFTCPTGYYLKKLQTNNCNSQSPTRKGPTTFSSLFWSSSNDEDNESPIPCGYCRFKLFSNGTISYEQTTGVYLRTSEWKSVEPQDDLYCIDGIINPTVSDCRNDSPHGCNNNDGSVVLYICLQNDAFSNETNSNKGVKTSLLAVIWSLSCPLLFCAALGNSLMIQRNIHGWILTCYLLSTFVLNIFSVLFILSIGRDAKDELIEDEHNVGKCEPADFAIKYTYMSTLCWMTSINFGLWKTFKYTLPEPVGIRRFTMSALFSLGFPAISVTVSYFMAWFASDPNCESQYCLLYSYYTIPFFQFPIFLLVFGNFAIFIKTSYRIALLQRESADILQRQAQDHLKSFALFTKLFLLTGSIWLVRIVLFVLQLLGLYLSWYGIVLEVMFSLPEIIFPIIVLHHPEFIKWSWNRAPRVSRLIGKFNPLFQTTTRKQSVLPA